MREELYRSIDAGGTTTITLEATGDGGLQLFYHDIGEEARRSFGDSDYEAWATVPAVEVPKLAFALLAERWRGDPRALSAFRDFCRERAIAAESGSWT